MLPSGLSLCGKAMLPALAPGSARLCSFPRQAPGALPTCATLFNVRDVKHGDFKVTADKPLRYFAVHVVDKGKALYRIRQFAKAAA